MANNLDKKVNEKVNEILKDTVKEIDYKIKRLQSILDFLDKLVATGKTNHNEYRDISNIESIIKELEKFKNFSLLKYGVTPVYSGTTRTGYATTNKFNDSNNSSKRSDYSFNELKYARLDKKINKLGTIDTNYKFSRVRALTGKQGRITNSQLKIVDKMMKEKLLKYQKDRKLYLTNVDRYIDLMNVKIKRANTAYVGDIYRGDLTEKLKNGEKITHVQAKLSRGRMMELKGKNAKMLANPKQCIAKNVAKNVITKMKLKAQKFLRNMAFFIPNEVEKARK